jgi:hypothetical protein
MKTRSFVILIATLMLLLTGLGCGGSGSGGGSGFTITPEETTQNTITPTTPQQVAAGGSVTFTQVPASGGAYLNWTLDNGLVTSSGTTPDGTVVTLTKTTMQLSSIAANHSVGLTTAGPPPPP